jgi:hypothetical protein
MYCHASDPNSFNVVEGVIVRNSGHWLMEEAPDQVIPKLIEFLNSSSGEFRLIALGQNGEVGNAR